MILEQKISKTELIMLLISESSWRVNSLSKDLKITPELFQSHFPKEASGTTETIILKSFFSPSTPQRSFKEENKTLCEEMSNGGEYDKKS